MRTSYHIKEHNTITPTSRCAQTILLGILNALELSLKPFDLAIVEILHLLCIKLVMGVKIKAAADSKLNDSTKTNVPPAN